MSFMPRLAISSDRSSAYEDVAQLVVFVQRVVERQHGSAGQAEDVADAEQFETANDGLSACHSLAAGDGFDLGTWQRSGGVGYTVSAVAGVLTSTQAGGAIY